jgi:hypothetical protein
MTSDGAEGNRPTYAMESRMTWHPISTYCELVEGDVPDYEVRSADGRIVRAAFNPDDGWMDLTDPENPVEMGFVPVEWRTK